MRCRRITLLVLIVGQILAEATVLADCMKWVLRTDAVGPGPQTRHCMTYNPDRKRVVLFTADAAADLWEFDGVRWDRVFVGGPQPSARLDSAMTYDRRRHELVLVGGFGHAEQTELGDTWTCRISTDATGTLRGQWVRRADFPGYSAPDPDNAEIDRGETGARAEHALIYDDTRGLVLLFGGKARIIRGERWQDAYNRENYSSGSGAWNGEAWIDRRWADPRPMIMPDPDEPPTIGTLWFRHELGRKQVAAAYDLDRGRVITFGGLRQIYQSRTKDNLVGSLVDEAYIEALPHLQFLADNQGFPGTSRQILWHSPARCGQADLSRVYGTQLVHDRRRDRYISFGGAYVTGELHGGVACAEYAGVDRSTFTGQVLSAPFHFQEWDPKQSSERPNLNVQLQRYLQDDGGLPAAPAPRIGHTMAYDEHRDVTVVYGGWNGIPASLNTLARETWEYAPGLLEFLEQPAARTEVCLGDSVSLSITPLAMEPPFIQWYKGSLRIEGANQRTLTLTAVTRDAEGTYTCELTDPCGNHVLSREAVIRVGGPPLITGQPADVHVCPGETAEARFLFESDFAATVQWFRIPLSAQGTASLGSQSPVAGAESNVLRFEGMSPTANGFYRARVINRCGSAWTEPVEITAGVWLRVEPKDSTNLVCASLGLNVLASGNGTLRYQWRRNAESLTNSDRVVGTARPGLQFASLQYRDDASYDCIVSDNCNSLTTRVAKVTVDPNPPFVLSDTNGPAGRSYHQMVYDPVRGRTVLFGGLRDATTITAAYLNDTWEYDGTRWTQCFPSNSPSSRIRFSMAFDAHRGRVVLFGGATNNGFHGDLYTDETWEYDGTNWMQRFPARSPAPRVHGALFYNPVQRVTTLYGGDTRLPNPRAGDIWTWDGTNWTERVVTGDRPFFGSQYGSVARPQMVWDEARGYAVHPPMVANEPGTLFHVTWLWDGERWMSRPQTFEGFGITPTWAGFGCGIAYDSFRREVVYWGGGGFDQTSLWRWNGTSWKRDTIDEAVGYSIDCAATYDERRQTLVQFGGNYSGPQAELRGQSSRTYERILADEPVLLRPPEFLDDPRTNRVFLRIIAAGAPPLTYQWLRNGVPLANGTPYSNPTNASLAVDRHALDDGLYQCVVRGRCGEVTSPAMTLNGVMTSHPTLRITSVPGPSQPRVRLTWESIGGRLESGPSLLGPWNRVPGATSPFEMPAADATGFFRIGAGP